MKAPARRRERPAWYAPRMPRRSTPSPPPLRGRFARLTRAWLVAALLAAPAWAHGSAAELSVTAHGRQRLDLASGRTVLEDGGELTDRRSGVRLVAAWIAYAEGVEVVAREARIEGDLGSVVAAEVTVDLASGRLTATGGVAWERDGLEVRGGELRFDADAGIAWLAFGVVASAPAASAEEVWVEIAGGRVLLVGPYRYAEGPLALSGGEGSSLQLDVVATPGGPVYDARTEVEPGWLASVERLRRDAWAGADE